MLLLQGKKKRRTAVGMDVDDVEVEIEKKERRAEEIEECSQRMQM